MTLETQNDLFNLLSFAPGPLWLILLIIPLNTWAMRLFDVCLLAGAILYAVIVLPGVPALIPVIASPTFAAIQAMLGTSEGTLASWNHMILGDLWIGRWVVHDMARLGDSAWLRLPFLITILFFGPLGWAAYLIYRILRHKRLALV